MSDDLVERVAFAVCVDAGTNHVCKIACIDCRKEARAAIAVVLEQAAKVAENFTEPNPFPTRQGAIAAAIRALVKHD